MKFAINICPRNDLELAAVRGNDVSLCIALREFVYVNPDIFTPPAPRGMTRALNKLRGLRVTDMALSCSVTMNPDHFPLLSASPTSYGKNLCISDCALYKEN